MAWSHFVHITLLLLVLDNVSEARMQQPYRTAYHFQPPKNWINDPNGPMVYKGVYHLFYQYNPKGAVWGNIIWAHSTSKDLVNWDHQDPAIYPTHKPDQNGCWSGSATILPSGKPVIMYTGINPENQQVQNLAMPRNYSDPFLREWVKYPGNPLMDPTKLNKINGSSFRDPTTFWQCPDGKFRVIVGNKMNRVGKALLYRSHVNDITTWVEAQHPLHSSRVGMWECPDFFHLSNGKMVKYVMKASLDDYKHDYYAIGSYDCRKDVFFPDDRSMDIGFGFRYDYGKFYASKTFFDSVKKRRVLLGWCNESSPVYHDVRKGWAGVHVVPRRLMLDGSGKQLVQWPVEEVERLRGHVPGVFKGALKGGEVREVGGVTAAQADVEVVFDLGRSVVDYAEEFDSRWSDAEALCRDRGASVAGKVGPFGVMVLASEGLREYTAVFFRIFRTEKKAVVLMCSDQSRSSLDKSNDRTTYGAFVDVDITREKLSLRILIDHSIVESFGGGGKACITARVYPTIAVHEKARLYAFNYGSTEIKISKLKAWSMKKANIR